MCLIYKIRFYNWWHCGSGVGAGFETNEAVIKDESGFPFVPGTTLKGLFREGAEVLFQLTGDEGWREFLSTTFGNRPGGEHRNNSSWDRVVNRPGQAWFSNAELSLNMKKELAGNEILKSFLFEKITSTSVNHQTGVAREGSLRSAEAVIPLSLYGKVENCLFPDKMRKCLQWVKRLGLKRSRGWGRCDITLMEDRG